MSDAIDFFTDPSLVDDPFPYFDHLRAQCPAQPLPHHVVGVTGYDAATEVWRDPATYSACNSVTGPFPGLPPRPDGVAIDDHIARHRAELPLGDDLATQDPPTHTALRGLLVRLLTPKRLKENEQFMRRLVDRQLDAVVPAGRFEVLQGFAKPYALLVIADLLGVPEQDHQEFRKQLGAEQLGPGVGVGVEQRQSLDPLGFLFDTFSAPLGSSSTRSAPTSRTAGEIPATTSSPSSPQPPIPTVPSPRSPTSSAPRPSSSPPGRTPPPA